MQNAKEKLADFTARSLWIVTSLVMAAVSFLEYGQDFQWYFAAARILLEGGNPYDYTRVSSVLLEVTGRAGYNPFFYPLWFGWLITPLSLLPFQIARAIWMLLNLTLWLFGLIRLQQLLDFPRPGWRGWLVHLLATVVFAWTTWKFEQIGILLFVIAVELLIAYQKGQWNRLGIFLALALIKPNVMLIPIGVIGVWLVRRQNLRPVITALILLAGLVLLTTALTPGWYQPFLQPGFGKGLTVILDGPSQATATRVNTTLLDWLKGFAVPESVRIVMYAAVVLIGVWVLIRTVWKAETILEVMVVSLLVSFAITPYALQYDYPPLTIVLYWAMAYSSRAGSKVIPALVLLFVTSVLVWERPISDGYWIVIGLAGLSLWVVRHFKDTSSADDSR
ncbi:MAG TPA: glycosyltransferase family 87 protein, partial [Anaerolineales bacterium]|nr:glycosyltransferase family 87 protein [Anaerolineales bacterium]